MDEGYSDYLTALGARIRVRRKECGLSYTNLVRQYGYGSAQWGKYERGGGLSLPTLVKLALILKTTPSALLDGIPLPELEQLANLRTPQESPRSLRPSEIAAKKAKAS